MAIEYSSFPQYVNWELPDSVWQLSWTIGWSSRSLPPRLTMWGGEEQRAATQFGYNASTMQFVSSIRQSGFAWYSLTLVSPLTSQSPSLVLGHLDRSWTAIGLTLNLPLPPPHPTNSPHPLNSTSLSLTCPSSCIQHEWLSISSHLPLSHPTWLR